MASLDDRGAAPREQSFALAPTRWLAFGPGALVGAGIIGSTLIARAAAGSGWLVLSGPLLLSSLVVGADVLESRLVAGPAGPTAPALILAGAILLASSFVAVQDPGLLTSFLPVLGIAAWVAVLLRPEASRGACRDG